MIIDEGQDFPDEMYFCIHNITEHFKRNGIESSLTVFADENQIIVKDDNCTIKEIEMHLKIKSGDHRKFYLLKNFRNTRQIANFSNYFMSANLYKGNLSLPSNQGQKPLIAFYPYLERYENKKIFEISDAKYFQNIKNILDRFPNRKVGLILDANKNYVAKCFNILKALLEDSSYKVQAYISQSQKEHFKSENLDFVSNNVLTILNKQSSKGTEFDIVIYMGIEYSKFNESDGINQMKNMFVVSSRAREYLIILFCSINIKDQPVMPDILSIFPHPEELFNRYQFFGLLKSYGDNLLDQVEWK